MKAVKVALFGLFLAGSGISVLVTKSLLRETQNFETSIQNSELKSKNSPKKNMRRVGKSRKASGKRKFKLRLKFFP